jgi:hypothetical protein
MIPCVVFLNELSYRGDDTMTPAEIVPIILSTLSAIRAAQKIRQDLIVAGTSPISKIAISNGTHSLASLLRGNNYKEEWRFITGLDQSSPGDASWNFYNPHELEEVTFQGIRAVGMLLATRSQSLVLSFGFRPHWDRNQIAAQLADIDGERGIAESNISVPNVATPQHATDHSELIFNYGKQESASSILCESDEFVARMYFYDHDPPHFHVCLPSAPARTLATYSVDTLDTLKGNLKGSMQRRVRQWAAPRRPQLMDNWSRCKTGQHPFRLED